MGWRDGLGVDERAAFDTWLANVLHDLVKYLELMPRNLDWDDLEEDDADLLYEAIFETRVDRHGSRSARTLWVQALEGLPAGLGELPVRDAVSAHISVLEGCRAKLEAGDLAGIDIGALREALFGVGTLLRGLKA